MDLYLRSGHRQKKITSTNKLKLFSKDTENHIHRTHLTSETINMPEFAAYIRTSPRRQNGFDQQLFKTDETPVAVPVNSPPTPHRINMTRTESEDSEKPNIDDNADEIVKIPMLKSPSSVLSNMQNPGKKTLKKGRRKLNGVLGNQELMKSVVNGNNHKLTDYFPVRRSVRKCKKTVLEEQQRDFENKVLCQVEDGLKVKHFAGKGRGIVTTREFRKGEFVVEYVGELIDQTVAKKREAEYARDQNTGCYMYYFKHRNHQYCVDATPESEKLGRLVNHSRNGNLIARVIEVECKPHLVLTAKEDLPCGVEVTYDYGDRSRESIRNHPWLAL